MSYSNAKQSTTLRAAGDLSASQNCFVLVNSDGRVAVVASAGGDADGVLQNDPAAIDREAEVAFSGVVKVVAGDAVTRGAKVQSDALGRAITAASGDHVLGRALETAGAAGDIIAVLLNSSHHILA